MSYKAAFVPCFNLHNLSCKYLFTHLIIIIIISLAKMHIFANLSTRQVNRGFYSGTSMYMVRYQLLCVDVNIFVCGNMCLHIPFALAPNDNLSHDALCSSNSEYKGNVYNDCLWNSLQFASYREDYLVPTDHSGNIS